MTTTTTTTTTMTTMIMMYTWTMFFFSFSFSFCNGQVREVSGCTVCKWATINLFASVSFHFDLILLRRVFAWLGFNIVYYEKQFFFCLFVSLFTLRSQKQQKFRREKTNSNVREKWPPQFRSLRDREKCKIHRTHKHINDIYI